MKQLYSLLIVLACIAGASIPANAVNYFWIGGSGNWSDINHWATTSGGSVLQSIVPTVNDNVLFDAGSGFTAGNSTVTLNVAGFCDSMIWGGAATPLTFSMNNGLQIHGSLVLQVGMTVVGNSGPTFTSPRAAESITTNNVNFNNNGGMVFNGTATWTFQDSMKITGSNGNINFTNGGLNFNGQYVTFGRFISDAGNSTRTLNIANSIIRATFGNFNAWSYTGGAPLIAANSAGSEITFTGNGASMAVKAGDVYNNVLFTGAAGTAGISNGTYNKVSFANNGNVSSINTDSLLFTSGKVYRFTSGTTTTINEYWTAQSPACTGLIDLGASTAGSQATISVGVGAIIQIANARIQDLNITGPAAPYAATGSISVSNNTGWAFTPPTPHTYYWVGGTGNWNDGTHWANASGGVGGSGCVPIPVDNVIFDAGSGFTPGLATVFVDGNAYCDSMTWDGSATSPTLNLVSPLQINGSLVLQAGMTVVGNNGIGFVSTRAAESITTNNVNINNNGGIAFDGTATWTFQDSMKVTGSNGNINFTNGGLNFNGQYVTFGRFISTGGNSTRTMNIANSIIVATFGNFNAWSYTGGVPLIAANSAGSEITFTGNGASMAVKAGDVYNNVLFTGTGGTAGIANGIYNKVSFANNGSISSINTDSLLFTGGKIYRFASFTTTTINEYWTAQSAACAGLIDLGASSAGSQATISIGLGAIIQVANARIQDLNITGPAAPYAAAGSINVSNNTGWTFTAPIAHTYYWVGGTGNWNDGTHWATSSGGVGGSGCVPSQFDNVIFDASSGLTAASTVTVDGNAFCDSMTWSGSATPPTLNVVNPLQINGSLVLQAGMTVVGSNGIGFTSTRTAESITTNNVNLNNNGGIGFSGTATWTLQDSLKVTGSNGNIAFSSGGLNFNGQYVTMSGFQSAGGNATRTLNIANSIIDVTSFAWNYTGGVPLTAANSDGSKITVLGNNAFVFFSAKPGDVYNDVVFTSTGQSPPITNGIYNSVSFAGNGSINGGITTDTLLFTAGNTYTFESGTTTTINDYWFASGNPCFPSTIQSSSTGVVANVSMPATAANLPGGIFGIDFVRMRDINAVTGAGRAGLLIGNQSIDNGNNPNWTIIPYAGPSGITGLGNDTTLNCNSFPFLLNTLAFQGNPSTTYQWDNGSTIQLRFIDTTGSYHITVNYGAGCVISDTINISRVPNLSVSVTSAHNASDFEVTLNVTNAVGTLDFTLDSVIPAGITVPFTQLSPLFDIPDSITQATFTVTDETTGCTADLTIDLQALPVTLTSFTGKRHDDNDMLYWTTTSEKNTDHFEVEYSPDARQFSKLAQVAANGNSTLTKNYNYVNAGVDGNTWYRLRIVDVDGRYAYSAIVQLSGSETSGSLIVSNIYPLPFTDKLTVNLSNIKDQSAQFSIMDINGRDVIHTNIALQKGIGAYTLNNLGTLAPGLYYLRIITDDGQTFVQKLMK